MSEANAALHGPYRRKPCTFCSESGRQCAFDSKSRGRRGPRPRQPASQAPRVTQPLAPRRPSIESTSTAYIEPSIEVLAEAPVDIIIAPVIESTIQVSVEPVWNPSQLPRVEEMDKSDEESAVEGDDALDPTEWKPILEQLLSPTSQILQRTITRGLILAICASSMRFSVHKDARQPRSADLAQALGDEAMRCVQSSAPNQPHINNIQTICLLVDYEASRDCGRRAWMGIDTARILDAAEQHLIIAELSHSIGHPSLQPPSYRRVKRPRPEKRVASFPEGTQRLMDLLEVLIGINQLCIKPLKDHIPLPWNTNSDFRALQDELEEYLLWYPSIFRMGPREAPGLKDQEDTDEPMSSLIWHCSAILLNRTFLPIPERGKTANESQASLVRCVDFPEAPPLFLKERIHRCESSADAICDIAQDIISSGGFFSHTLLLGYSCTQSALVLINRLHRSSKPYNKKVVGNLKLLFIILGAVRTFYSPAQAWIDALFCAHDINTPLKHVSGDRDAAFSSYFGRFVDVEEPAFVPLDPKESKDKSDAETYPHEAPKDQASTNGQGHDGLESSENPSTWLQTYVGHLGGDIHDEEDELNGPHGSSVTEAGQTSLMDPATAAAARAQTMENPYASRADAGIVRSMTDVNMMGKGFTPYPPQPDLMADDDNMQGTGSGGFPGDIDELYPELFSQIPSLGDFIGMGHEIPIFPGLESLLEGDGIWSDVDGHDSGMDAIIPSQCPVKEIDLVPSSALVCVPISVSIIPATPHKLKAPLSSSRPSRSHVLTMERNFPQAERQNEKGACWTCVERNWQCDGTLPRCKACSHSGVRCRGYGVRMQWPPGVVNRKARTRWRQIRTNSTSSSVSPLQINRSTAPTTGSMSSLGLPAEDSFFMQHFMQNVARVALAIDYDGNGYRSLLPMAMTEPALMGAAMAVAASHYSRWQHTSDLTSRKYLRAAAKALRTRFSTPNLVHSPVTLASMLLFVSYEVFAGSSRWEGHYDAIKGWIRSRGDCSDLDPFLKTWVCLLDTQSALNMGCSAMPELEAWLDETIESITQEQSVDALFGCSSKLPKLMWAASRLYAASKSTDMSRDELMAQADALQDKIRSTEIALDSHPLVGISCHGSPESFTTSVGIEQEELRRRMVATAEIFRHASHIYVYRIVHGPEEPLTPEMRISLDTAQHLLTVVPDALGPGANLGWCLVVLGAEMDLLHERDYVRSRWAGLHLLGIYNTKNGQKISEETWSHRDLVSQGQASPERWQDIMQRIGQSQILV
ncbi:C6 transcription factor [Dactylonectria estremocensis]|uniref:C6 transcription factor n=1 Tax=Dactylonectria estremocensis TaxID=1079267 RepID=A0A9P9IL74_9HYPO|nr:C6 transcription factor [Dactylonectria estremocensis]